MSILIYVGVDVHKDTNSICMYDAESNRFFNEVKLPSGSQNVIRYLERSVKTFHLKPESMFIVGYEAGPTGYSLCRDLKKAGIVCAVMAPATIAVPRGGNRTKTDRRDARLLAVSLASNVYKQIYIPTDKDEAVRECTRTRNALKKHLKKAKQELLSFLLRMNSSYPEPGRHAWTAKYWERLESLRFANQHLQMPLEEHIQEIRDLESKIERMDKVIEEISLEPECKENAASLVCFKGIKIHTALSIIVEAGDFSRFADAKSFSSYIGLCPGQDSCGLKTRMTSITKAGNSQVRTLLSEAAKSIKKSTGSKTKEIKRRQAGASPGVIAYADRGTKRIKSRIHSLEFRGKPANVATTAAARELSCFIWGMMAQHIY